MTSRLDFKNRLDFDSRAGGNLGETEGAAGVIAVAGLAVDFVEQVAAAVDHEMLLIELKC